MGIVLNGWAHANDDTPGAVTREDEHGVVDGAELSVMVRIHRVPLVEVD